MKFLVRRIIPWGCPKCNISTDLFVPENVYRWRKALEYMLANSMDLHSRKCVEDPVTISSKLDLTQSNNIKNYNFNVQFVPFVPNIWRLLLCFCIWKRQNWLFAANHLLHCLLQSALWTWAGRTPLLWLPYAPTRMREQSVAVISMHALRFRLLATQTGRAVLGLALIRPQYASGQ